MPLTGDEIECPTCDHTTILNEENLWGGNCVACGREFYWDDNEEGLWLCWH